MDPQEYLTEIKAQLVVSSAVASIAVVEERALPDRGYFRTVKKVILLAMVLGVVFFRSGPAAWGQEVPYTLEDRDRLIRVEATLKEFKESVDKRIEGVDKRIESVDNLTMSHF